MRTIPDKLAYGRTRCMLMHGSLMYEPDDLSPLTRQPDLSFTSSINFAPCTPRKACTFLAALPPTNLPYPLWE